MFKAMLGVVAFMVSVGIAAAAPELQAYATTGSGWQVFYHSVSHNCGMVREHQLGTRVVVNYNSDNDSWTFSLSNQKWDLVRPGQRYDVLLTFEDGSKWEGGFTGQIFNGRPMISLLNTKLDFIKQFMAHDKLTIRTRSDGTATTVDLDGSWDGMMQVAACQKAHRS